VPLRPLVPVEPGIRFEKAPGVKTQADWKALGSWPLGDEMVELHAMVAVLGHSRRPAIRMATCRTREVSFERLVRCLADLGGVTREILTNRDTVFWFSAAAGLSPEWVGPLRPAGRGSPALPTVPGRRPRAKWRGSTANSSRASWLG
jgi:transposase